MLAVRKSCGDDSSSFMRPARWPGSRLVSARRSKNRARPRSWASAIVDAYSSARKASPPGRHVHGPASRCLRALRTPPVRRQARSDRTGARASQGLVCSTGAFEFLAGGEVHARSRGRSTVGPEWRGRSSIASVCVASQHRARLARRIDVAVGHHGMASAAFTAKRWCRTRPAAVALLARAAVHRHHRHAGRFRRCARCAPRCACWRHQPVRIFSVTGTPCGAQAATTASMMAAASGSSRISAEPAHALAHPLGRAAHVDVDDLRAALDVVGGRPAIIAASVPAICTAMGSLSPRWSARRLVFRLFHSSRARSPSADRIACAQPLLHSMRNGAVRSPWPSGRRTAGSPADVADAHGGRGRSC